MVFCPFPKPPCIRMRGYFFKKYSIKCYNILQNVYICIMKEEIIKINEPSFSVGDIIDVMSFGKPAQEEIIEWSEKHQMFKCAFIGGNGSCWRAIDDIMNMKKRVEEYNRLVKERIYWQNGGHNGPTGHGPDICYSDADCGL